MLIPSNRTKRECILSRLCFLVLSVWVSLPSAAQNNPYKIDDALYPIYQRASKQARQQEGLLVADTLYQQALKLGDKKAQCLAYIIPLQFYISQKDDSKIEKASTDLKEISRANNYLQYYYHAWSSEIIYFLNQQRSLLALQKAEKMKKQAFADRYPYGIFSCIRTMGHIYKSRGNFDLSAQYYQEALDYMLKNMPDQDPSQLYSSLAEYYRNTQKDYATALDYCEKALKSAKTERNIAQAMIEKCLVLFRQGRIDEFNDCYKEAVQMADRCKLSASVSLLIAHISKNILDKQYEQAHAHADQLSEEGLQTTCLHLRMRQRLSQCHQISEKIPPAVGFDEQSPATVGHRRTEHPDRRRTPENGKHTGYLALPHHSFQHCHRLFAVIPAFPDALPPPQT